MKMYRNNEAIRAAERLAALLKEQRKALDRIDAILNNKQQ